MDWVTLTGNELPASGGLQVGKGGPFVRDIVKGFLFVSLAPRALPAV